MARAKRQRAALLLLVVTAILAAPRCRSARITRPGPIDLTKSQPSKYEPRDPFKEIAPGAFGRLEFQSEDTLGVRIDVRQILVAPRQTATLPYTAAAVYAVRAGTGTAEFGGARQELQGGSVFLVGQGQELKITNTGTLPLGLDVHLIEPLK